MDQHLIGIARPVFQPRNKQFKDAGILQTVHRIFQAVPVIKTSDHADTYCIRRPHTEYYTAHDLEKAEFCLKEAIRISPNYLYPYLNLAYIYLSENEPQKAKAVADGIYFDEHKRDVMKADAIFFEPFNAEAVRRKIDADYEATRMLYMAIFEKMKK